MIFLRKARIALFQMSMNDNEYEVLNKCLKAIKKAAKQACDIILFPELTLHKFFPQYEAYSVSDKLININHDFVKAFEKVCRENKIYAVPNFYLNESEKAYDASILIGRNGEISGIQKMVHIAQAENFFEQSYYTPSDDGFHVFDTDFGKIGITVCFDRHYPESIRTESLIGAELILIPTANTENEPMKMFDYEIKVQAFQSCVPIAMCNRTGKEDNMIFSGKSEIIDSDGNKLFMADEKEQLIIFDVDMDSAKKAKEKRPYTSLRRKEFYI